MSEKLEKTYSLLKAMISRFIMAVGALSMTVAFMAFAENLAFIGTTDKNPLLYDCNEKMTFTVTLVDRDNNNLPVPGRTLRWQRNGDDVKVVILTGGPDKKGNEFKSFVAGADIAEMAGFTAPQARAFGIKASEPFFKLMNMRQVTIAAVNGFALGGGCEISMACDIRIASENAIFGQPETGLGIIPGFGGTQRLARLVGMGRAKEMIFTCDNVDAAEAYRIGLVNKVVAKEELMPTAKAMAAKIISKGSYAIAVAKAAINNGYDMDIKNAVEMEANLFGVVNDTNDKKEGMGAFLEKRAANLTDF